MSAMRKPQNVHSTFERCIKKHRPKKNAFVSANRRTTKGISVQKLQQVGVF